MALSKVLADDVGMKVARALGLEPRTVQRIILDMKANSLLRIYVLLIPEQEAAEIDWDGEIKRSELELFKVV